ncbi:MAG: nucleoside 2-deoxyribosyltransferase [Salinivirgaceae bacterium]|nr:nucleoside 2-deoxyribosyltransferase [Salinivirgaceae bacterium]
MAINRKIYFAGSIRGGREDAEKYHQIINYLRSYGEVLTEHVGDDELLKQEKSLSEKEIHDRDMAWLTDCEYVVAEVTQPSLGVGYELAMALTMKKQVICFFHSGSGKRLSAMIAGQPYYKVKNYNEVSEIESYLREIF